MKQLLKERVINAYHVTSRTKGRRSFRAKLEQYQIRGERVQDLVGLRIIAYELSDIDKICNCIKDNFTVKREKSFTGSESNGYRSIHFVCRLRENRLGQEKFTKFLQLIFEIQVRTILQHTWAEIGHERNYKFTAGLPPDLQNRFDSLAQDLKVIDEKFKQISMEIDHYRAYMAQKESYGLKFAIKSQLLRQYMLERMKNIPSNLIEVSFGTAKYALLIVEELEMLGIKTFEDLDKLITNEFIDNYLQALCSLYKKSNFLEFIRNLIIVKFASRYSQLPRKRKFDFYPEEVRFLNELGIDHKTLQTIGKLVQ